MKINRNGDKPVNKIPFSRIAPPCALLIIMLIDFTIAIKDVVNGRAATGVIIIVMGLFIGYAGIRTLLNTIKNNK